MSVCKDPSEIYDFITKCRALGVRKLDITDEDGLELSFELDPPPPEPVKAKHLSQAEMEAQEAATLFWSADS